MPLFEPRIGTGKRSSLPIYVRELERFRADILYETLREKGYIFSRELASIYSQRGSLEDAALDLRKVLTPPCEFTPRRNRPWRLWVLATVGAMLIAASGGIVFYFLEP